MPTGKAFTFKSVFFGSVENAGCGVRSVENAECGKRGVWQNEECGKCGVWKK